MDNQIKVRQIEKSDKDWVRKTLTDSWGSTIIIASKTFDAIELPGLIAEIDGKPLGLLTYNIEKEKLEVVSIDSTVEGKGVGSMLIEKSKEIAKEKGLKAIFLITSNDNLDALRFYQKRGLRITKVYPDAIDEARKIKPNIPKIGEYGIPLRDAIELEYVI